MKRLPVLDIPKGGLVWSTEVKLYARTGTWAETFVRYYLRVGDKDHEKRPPPELVKECEAARAAYLRDKRKENAA